VLLIRWVAAEIRVFAYIKNLVLMAAVLGLGIGCATSGKKAAPGVAFPILMLLVAALVATASLTGLTDISLLVDRDVYDFNVSVTSMGKLLVNVAAIAFIFILITGLFDMLGRELGKALSGMPPLSAYASNLLGSLAGVLAFMAMSALELGPVAWLAVGLAPLIPLYWQEKKAFAVFVVCSMCSVALTAVQSQGVVWSPYYRISTVPNKQYIKGITAVDVPYELGTGIDVNHNRHQWTVNLSKEFVEQHPELKESNDLRVYDLPFAAKQNAANVLILGAGTGNDVAAALRSGAQHVDAVEIDPVIADLGKKIHPERPYDDPRVTLHINDARAFLASGDKKYDVIQFGHLDSQTALSTASSVRLDNYLYTEQSLKQALRLLKDDGIACLNFATQPDWLRARIYQMVRNANGSEPLAFDTQYGAPKSISVICGPGLPAVRAELERKYAGILSKTEPLMMPVEIPSDDWPFLYQHKRNLPVVMLFLLLFVIGISAIMIFSRFKLRPGEFRRNLHFFLLGAGFLLMETRAMLAVAVLFASTWVVNSVIIALVLLMALLANYFVIKTKSR
jgi:SAM-dependent methyltransferase